MVAETMRFVPVEERKENKKKEKEIVFFFRLYLYHRLEFKFLFQGRNLVSMLCIMQLNNSIYIYILYTFIAPTIDYSVSSRIVPSFLLHLSSLFFSRMHCIATIVQFSFNIVAFIGIQYDCILIRIIRA